MKYLFVTETDKENAIARALYGRELEHLSYEVNRLNYEAVLAALAADGVPEQWPANLEKYQAIFGEKLVALGLSDEDFTTVTQLQYRDRVRVLLKTNNAERDKGVKVADALTAQLPKDKTQKDALILRTKEYFDAQKAV